MITTDFAETCKGKAKRRDLSDVAAVEIKPSQHAALQSGPHLYLQQIGLSSALTGGYTCVRGSGMLAREVGGSL